MKATFVFAFLLLAQTSQAKSIFDSRKPYERCGQFISSNFGSNDLIADCSLIQTEFAANCVEHASSGGTIQKGTVKACAYVNNKLSGKAVEKLARDYKVGFANIVTLSFIDTAVEASCVSNVLQTGSFQAKDLKACMDESLVQQEERLFMVVGVSKTAPSSIVKDMIEDLKKWWN